MSLSHLDSVTINNCSNMSPIAFIMLKACYFFNTNISLKYNLSHKLLELKFCS